MKRVAIVGLPNSGKSQLFNDLSGAYSVVANYPLTTVEPRTERAQILGTEYELVDTPGLHGMFIQSEEELVVRNELYANPPDTIIQCIAPGMLKQSLLLTMDLMDLEIPLIIVITGDFDKTRRQVDTDKLSIALGIDVVVRSLEVNSGMQKVKQGISKAKIPDPPVAYSRAVEDAIISIGSSFAANVRYKRQTALLTLSQDRFISLTAPLSSPLPKVDGNVSRIVGEAKQRRVDGIIDEALMSVKQQRSQNRADGIATLCRHPVYGWLILAAVVVVLYFAVVHVAGLIDAGLSFLIVDPVVGLVDRSVSSPFLNDFLIGPYGLLTLGIFNAFITVLPVLSIFFLILGLLEDTGYLPNLAVLTRRSLEKIGLSGRSVMSLILGFGCKTMATMTTKGITSKKEKFIAILLIAFAIPCSAQLALDMSILGRAGLLAFVIAYVFLVVVEVGAGFVLNKVIKEKSEGMTDFIQELPPIRVPRVGAIVRKTGYRILWFLKEAAPIFAIAALILFAFDVTGVLNALREVAEPVVGRWLGLPLEMVEVLILSIARHEAAAGLLLKMTDAGMLSYIQIIIAVVITTMFVPCFANIVAMCKEIGIWKGIAAALAINIVSIVLAGLLRLLLMVILPGRT